jgi:hypothetical protein
MTDTSRPDAHLPVSSAREVLDAMLARAKSSPGRAWVALDLDGTLFDNRPRTLAILQAFGMSKRHEVPELGSAIAQLGIHDLQYSPAAAVHKLGLPQAQLPDQFMAFWRERFFTNAWQAVDTVEPGAVAFAHALVDAGVGVVYLTGRDRPGMMGGVLQSLDMHGFPLMTAQTQVVLKPSFAMADVEFKRGALAELGKNGPVVGLVDNEPPIVNMALETVPDLVSVRICRPAAPNPEPLLAHARQIDSFLL